MRRAPAALPVPMLVLLLLPMLFLGACSTSPTAHLTNHSLTQTGVALDTPALRAAKQAAGVEACRPGTHRPGALPAVTLPCLGGGRPVDLAKLRGPLVINLFAQWCGPCRAELPFYQQLHTKAHGRLGVLGIDYEDTLPSRALQLVRQTGVTYPLLADPSGDLHRPFEVRGLPGVVTVDAAGHVHVEYTVIRSYAQLQQLVKQRLGLSV